MWLDQFTVDHPDAVVPKNTVLAAYHAASEAAGRPTLNANAFGRALRRLRPRIGECQRTVNGKIQWCYVGIGLIDDDLQGSRNSRNSRNSPIFVSRTREESDSREQNRDNPVNPVKPVNGRDDCQHVWQDERTDDGRVRVVCADCGNFHGYKKEQEQVVE